ncbi:MAG: hypothetical protein R3E68_13965 [Burkholderiaceae bacterium]
MAPQRPLPGASGARGIELAAMPGTDTRREIRACLDYLAEHDLADALVRESAPTPRLALAPGYLGRWTPEGDTLALAARLALPPQASGWALEREILVALLSSPVPYAFPSAQELASAVRIRCNTVEAARRTALAFDTDAAERPWDYWSYDEETGFTLREGKALIPALMAAIDPQRTGNRYAFSCYRASEYVMLVGIAQELALSNPALLAQLEARWRTRAIQSGLFHDVFLREYGSNSQPFPMRHYTPGDRVWFRNPDPLSSDVAGYEGSWVIYLGGGLFANFWKDEAPFTLSGKCVEVYHWRHAVVGDDPGSMTIDEAIVEARVRRSMADPQELDAILRLMQRYRLPAGSTPAGGCIDTTRESPRWVCPRTSELDIPAA